MKYTLILSIGVATAILSVIGCSNRSLPVTVNEQDHSTTAAIGDMLLRDIAVVGNVGWGLSNEKAVGDNYWMYAYDNRPQAWVKTSNYGIKIAVGAGTTKCYHINAESQIWWATMYSNGRMPDPPTSEKLIDIGVGKVGSFDVVWVTDGSQIFKYRPGPDGIPAWTKITKFDAGYHHGIAVDPYNGNSAAVNVQVILNGNGIFTQQNENSSWNPVNTKLPVWSLAICGDKIVYTAGNVSEGTYGIYVYFVADRRFGRTYYNPSDDGLCADKSYFYYFASHEGYPAQGSYNHIIPH
jgi:hypothetical protein